MLTTLFQRNLGLWVQTGSKQNINRAIPTIKRFFYYDHGLIRIGRVRTQWKAMEISLNPNPPINMDDYLAIYKVKSVEPFIDENEGEGLIHDSITSSETNSDAIYGGSETNSDDEVDTSVEDGHEVGTDFGTEMESPSSESGFVNLDGDTEELDIQNFVGDLRALMVEDSDEKVVLDSDDDLISEQKEGNNIGGFWRRAFAVGVQSSEV